MGSFLPNDDLTIWQSNAMQLTYYAWAATAQIESSKFWFYALMISILLTLHDIFFDATPKPTQPSSATSSSDKSSVTLRTKQVTTPPSPETLSSTRREVRKRQVVDLVIDICDLSIPGTAVGWLSMDKITIGVAMAISSILVTQRIWYEVTKVPRPAT